MRIAILGTGKMARDMGAHCLGRGHEVIFASTSGERLAAMGAEAEKIRRRLARSSPGGTEPKRIELLELPAAPDRAADVVLECTAEARAAKRRVMDAAEPLLRSADLVATNSSSLLPAEVWPGAVGLHCFFPITLTGFAEIITDDRSAPGAKERAVLLARDLGLDFALEDARNAFAVNRLLLPLQNEALCLLRGGAPPAVVDERTASSLLPMGQLRLLDEVGIDVIARSVDHYLSRLPAAEREWYGPLAAGLAELERLGKRGRKNKDGLLLGAPLPWSLPPGSPGEAPDAALLFALFLNTCLRFIEGKEVDGGTLDLVLRRVFGAERTLGEVRAGTDPRALWRALTAALEREGRGYFRPSALLAD